jgi:uncharacterized protein
VLTHHINWIELALENPEATRDFFRSVFHWEIMPGSLMEDYFIFNPGAGPMGAIHGHLQGGAKRTTVYLHCPDIDAKLAEVEAAGGSVVFPKTFIGEAVGHIAHFADPNGNVFGLWDRLQFGAPDSKGESE